MPRKYWRHSNRTKKTETSAGGGATLLAAVAVAYLWPKLAAWYADGTLLRTGVTVLIGLLLAVGAYVLIARSRPTAARRTWVRPLAPATPITGTSDLEGERRMAREASRALRGVPDARIFLNWLGEVDGRSVQVDAIVVLPAAVAVLEHKDLGAKKLYLNGGGSHWQA